MTIPAIYWSGCPRQACPARCGGTEQGGGH